MDVIWGFLQMAGLAIVSVSLWTMRVALTSRGRRVAGCVTAGLEALVFLIAFSNAAADLRALERLIGYAVGVAAGTLLGVVLDERLSAGQSEVRVVTEGHNRDLIRELQEEGWPVTSFEGVGPRGDVTVAFVAVDDVRVPVLEQQLQRSAPHAFWTVERLRSARGRSQPGRVQVGSKRLGSTTRFRKVSSSYERPHVRRRSLAGRR